MSKLFTIDELEHELRSLQARIDNDALNFIPGISENVSGLGAPSAGDLRKVNKLLPKGAEPLTADAITVVPIMAADNLINSYFYRFDPAALGQMLPYAMGTLFTVNHDWGDSGVSLGRIFDGSLLSVPSQDVPVSMINRNGNRKFNRKLLQNEGYWCMILRTYIRNDDPFLERIKSGVSSNVSIGGFASDSFLCGKCAIPYGQTVDGHKCTHYPAHPFFGRDLDDERESPFSTMTDMTDFGEVSMVPIGAIPNARVI